MDQNITQQNDNNKQDNQGEQTITIQSDVISGAKFSDIDLADFLQEELKRNNLVNMTHIQDLAMLHVIRGSDVAAKAHTGSGKSLAFLLPALDLIYRSKMRPHNGTGVIVIAPTRELALQLYKIAKQYACDRINIGLAVGGTSQQKETERLAQGCPLVISTPGRLKDHLLHSVGFKVSNLFMIVLDEADRLLDMGFQDEITQIMRLLPNQGERQTCLFSATLSDRVLNIPGLNLKTSLVKLDADQDKTFTIRQCFTQAYILCPLQLRFLLMYTFLKSKKNSKIIIFFSNCATVQFYSTFLRYIGLSSIYAISGQLKQSQRNQVAKEFTEVESGALLATNVAARGLDIPDVDYIIQFDPPDSVEEYVHRAGRACRGANPRPGTGILFLSEREMEFVEVLKNTGLALSEIEFPTKKIINVQHEMEEIIYRNYNFVQLAQQAFRDTISAYANHSMKKIFDVAKLDYQQLSTSFGLRQIPRVDILLGIQKKAFMEREKRKEEVYGEFLGENKKHRSKSVEKHGHKKQK